MFFMAKNVITDKNRTQTEAFHSKGFSWYGYENVRSTGQNIFMIYNVYEIKGLNILEAIESDPTETSALASF